MGLSSSHCYRSNAGDNAVRVVGSRVFGTRTGYRIFRSICWSRSPVRFPESSQVSEVAVDVARKLSRSSFLSRLVSEVTAGQ